MLGEILLWMVLYVVIAVPIASFIGKFIAFGLGTEMEEEQ